MFTDSEVKIAPAVILRREVAGTLFRDTSLGGGCKVCCSSDQPGDVFGGRVQHFRRGLASGQAVRVREEFRQFAVPTFRKLAVLHAEEFFGELGILLAILADSREPSIA